MKKMFATIAIALAATLGLAACSAPAPTITVSADTVIVDVRTPAEYSAGHLDGAVNIDVQTADFDSRVTALPTGGDYIVYCATGHRAGIAASRMTDLGFTTVANAGGVDEASAATGLAIVAGP